MTKSILIRDVFIADHESDPTLTPGRAEILVEDGRISAIGRGLSDDVTEIIEGYGAIAAPGFADSHRHIWQTGIRGVAADWSLADYVRQIRVGYATAFSPYDVYLSTLVGALEAIDTGVTSICDFSHIMNSPAHTEAAIQGLADSRIRGVYCYGFYDVPTRDRHFTAHDQRVAHADEVAKGFARKAGSLLDFGIATTETKLVTPDQTDAEIAVARKHDGLITLHVGTMGSPHGIAELDARGKLGSDMLFVHANMCSDEELRRMVETGASLSITPETEMQMGMGWPTTNRLLAVGGVPSFGVDIVSQNSGDMLTQLRIALQTARAIENQTYLDRGVVPDKIALTVRDALNFGTVGGIKAMKLGDDLGRLKVGARADIALFRGVGTNMIPFSDTVSMLMLQSKPGDADTVLIDGRIVKRHGMLEGQNLGNLREKLNDSFQRIAEEVEHSRDLEANTTGAYANVVAGATTSGG